MAKWSWCVGLAVCLLLVGACQRKPIDSAIRGSLLPTEENVVVRSYCQSCHVHVKFEEASHVEKHRLRYDEKSPLRSAARCLECHVLRPATFFRGDERETIFPHGGLIEIADIPEPQPAPRLEGGAGQGPRSETPAREKKKRRWYFLYLY